MTTRRLLSRMALVVAALAPGAFAQDRTVLIGSVLKPDGTIAPDTAVILAGGKIERVAPAAQAAPGPKDAVVRLADTHPGAVISPGLIDLRSFAGAMGDAFERLRPVDPQLSATDAVNLSDRFFQNALAAGITSVMIVPGETNIVGGAAATVRVSKGPQSGGSAWGGTAEILRADGPMTFTLGSSVLNQDRGPSSRSGVLSILRDAFAQAKGGKGDDRLAKVVNKQLDTLVVCESSEDVDAAARTFGEYQLKPNLVLEIGALESVDDLAGSGVTVVAGPLTFNSSMKALTGPARIAKAGLDVAFCGRTPLMESAGLRVTASLAVRYGLDPAQARRGLTATAARVAGVSDRIGSIEQGKDADLVIFSGDPLRLDSKVLDVYVKGTRAYTRPAIAGDATWHEASHDGGTP